MRSPVTLVSVIIPAYHNVTTLSRTLSSLLAQKHTAWDAIIACDGATDGTLEIARKAAENDRRVTALDLPHRGPSAARNAGIEKAKGEWLLFLDADDTVSPRFMAHMLRVAGRNPEAEIIACGYDRLDELGRNCGSFPPLPLDRDGLGICAAGPPGAIHSFLVRHGAASRVGGFDESLLTNEDWDFWLRLAMGGSRFATTSRRLSHYWSSSNSLTRDMHQMVRDSRQMIERIRNFDIRPRTGLEQFDTSAYPVDDLVLRSWMWSAGVAIGQGREIADAFEGLSREADCRYQKHELVQRLYNGLAIGSGTGYIALAQRWTGLRAGVEQILATLSRHTRAHDAARPIAHALQLLIARNGHVKGSMDFGLVMAVPLRLKELIRGYQPQSNADQIVFQLPFRPISWFSFDGPLTGPLTGRDVRRIIRRSIAARLERRLAERPLLSAPTRAHLARALALFRRLFRTKATHVGTARAPDSAMSILRKVEADLARSRPGPESGAVVRPSAHPDHTSGAADWDRFFETDNPWRYDSDYEQAKYTRTLSLIRPKPDGHALEIACAEGHFTAQLAPLFGKLTARDISSRAIARASARTAACGNVTFEQADVFSTGISASFDLITCSEMLYFAPSTEAIERLATQIATALRPGGQFVHAHAFLIDERPDRTAFDWDGTAGGDGIFGILSATAGLHHVRSIVTELYRIDLFEKSDPAQQLLPAPIIHELPLDCELQDRVAADVIWNGAVITRRKALQSVTTRQVPVLLFHGMRGVRPERADDPYRLPHEEFDQCLRDLRRHGYRSLDMAEWDSAARYSGRLRGKPLMITFDILDRTLVDRCWHMVRRNGFAAHVFTTPDELLNVAGNEQTVRTWIREGLTIGSRLDDRAPDILRSAELLEVAATTRLRLEALTGTPITTVAPPMGMIDSRIAELLRTAGYTRCFLDDGGIAPLTGMAMHTPRLDMAMDRLAAEMQAILGAGQQD
jgi:glycosyltransferase involved in cell wall biosynthesis/SAM-dependent methyltransferase